MWESDRFYVIMVMFPSYQLNPKDHWSYIAPDIVSDNCHSHLIDSLNFAYQIHLSNCSCQQKEVQLYIQSKENKDVVCDPMTVRLVNSPSYSLMSSSSLIEQTLKLGGMVLTDQYFKFGSIVSHSGDGFPENIYCRIDIRLRECCIRAPNQGELLEKAIASMGTMLSEGVMSDITIEVEGRQIRAHKCILASRSKVFKAMLQAPLKERQNGVVEIEDADYASVWAMLRFMYCSDTKAVADHELDVFVLADKYDLVDLKQYCVGELLNALNMENVLDMARFADRYNAEAVFEGCCRCFTYYRDRIMRSDEWNLLKEENCMIALKMLEFCIRSL